MADATKPNSAGLYFVNALGKIVPENSQDVVAQYDEEGLKVNRLGHYATLSDDEARLRLVEAKANEAIALEKDRQARQAANATPSRREAELESRVAALEAELADAKAARTSANKAVAGSTNK